MQTFKQKLLAVQQELKPIKKTAENDYFKSKYFDINALLEQVTPILNKHGLVVTQPLRVIEGRNALETHISDADGDEYLHSFIFLPDIADPQKLGSAITYFRRYSLQSLLGLEAEDDDANFASGKSKKAKVDTTIPPFDDTLPSKKGFNI